MPHKRESIDIDGTGASVILEKPGDHKVNVRVSADAAISADLNVSDRDPDNDSSPFTHKSYSSVSDVDDTGLDITERFIEFTVTTGTGGSGDTADVFISSAGTHP